MAEPEQNYGEQLLQWKISERHIHERGMLWYFVVGIIAVVFLSYAVSSHNFLFAFIIIMFGVILATHSLRPVVEYEVTIAEKGIKLGEKFYPWKELKQFWITQEAPAIKTLHLEFSGFRPRLPIPMEELEPDQIRELLSGRIAENTDNTEEPISDWLARILKI